MEPPPVLLMIVAKISNKYTYWLLPSKISLLSTDVLSKLATSLSELCYGLCDNIILYSTALISEWRLEKYCKKIHIAHEHFLDLRPSLRPLHIQIALSSAISVDRVGKRRQLCPSLPSILSPTDLCVLIGGDGPLKN